MTWDHSVCMLLLQTKFGRLTVCFVSVDQLDACNVCYGLSLFSVVGAQASIDVSNPQTDPRCMPISDIQSALGLQQGVNSRVWKIINPCILILTLVLLRGLVYIALRKKTSRV